MKKSVIVTTLKNGEEYGIVALVRKTGELIHEKVCPDILSNYYCHAWRRLEKYQRDNNFPEKDLMYTERLCL